MAINPFTYSDGNLTVGIPAYNRISEIRSLVDQLINADITKFIQVLIVDDSGTGAIFSYFEGIGYIDKYKLQIHINKNNIGYSSSFARLFKECKTAYLMVMADDDLIESNGIGVLIDFLAMKPSFVSPKFLINNEIERGISETRKILPFEFRSCSNHAPGLVYRIDACAFGLKILTERTNAGKADALLYPQVIIVASLLFSNEDCYWLNAVTAVEGANVPSGLRDVDGDGYWSFSSRCKQILAFDELLEQFKESNSGKIMLKSHRKSSFAMVAGALSIENPDLYRSFACSANTYYVEKRIKLILHKILPTSIFYFIRKLINNRIH